MTAQVRIGTSGWAYKSWHGPFYPSDLRQGDELGFLANTFATVELNASFYSLRRPENYQQWASQTPGNFVFSVKGSRFITHMKRLRDATTPLANFLASGVLALGAKLGPIAWQLPPSTSFDPERLAGFFDQLPRTTREAAQLAIQHDERLTGRTWTQCDVDQPLRHALEVRHSSFKNTEFIELLRAHQIGLVIADAASDWPQLEDITADFVYLRFHGSKELYASGYTPAELERWAGLIQAWRRGESPSTEHTVAAAAPSRQPRDVYAYFDNDMHAYAPNDARALMTLLNEKS